MKRHANAGASRTMVQQLGQPFHADLQPVLAPLETPFDDLPMLVKEKQDRKNDLLASRGASRMVHVATRINEHPAMKRAMATIKASTRLQKHDVINTNKLTYESFYTRKNIIYVIVFAPIKGHTYADLSFLLEPSRVWFATHTNSSPRPFSGNSELY